MGRKKINQDKITIDIDTLCDLVNSKYNLKPNQIGSIEWHNDMCENAIVQIINQRNIILTISGSTVKIMTPGLQACIITSALKT